MCIFTQLPLTYRYTTAQDWLLYQYYFIVARFFWLLLFLIFFSVSFFFSWRSKNGDVEVSHLLLRIFSNLSYSSDSAIDRNMLY